MIKCKNFWHVLVRGMEEKLLPVVVYIQDDDISYFISNCKCLRDDIVTLVSENISDIEQKARSDSKAQYRLLSSQAFLFAAAYSILNRYQGNYDVLHYNNEGGLSSPSLAPYTVTFWLAPSSKSAVLNLLLTE